MKRLNVGIAILLTIAVTGCSLETKLEKEEKKLIENFVQKNGIDVGPRKSGLYYVPVVEGTGLMPVKGDTVFIWYTGKYLDDKVLDSNIGKEIFEFVIGDGQVISGMDEGIQLMKQGGKAGLLIPSWLAYGPTGWRTYDPYYGFIQLVPGFSPLWFDIELVNVKPGTE